MTLSIKIFLITDYSFIPVLTLEFNYRINHYILYNSTWHDKT